ncbi:MAG TPA: Gfo/Idh/MocA family oxidoreductase [Verrucomicrobiota bacterium]|nr:Gfo/Idh/MocA family oxidoreductase [Verrucomicrobiota bacterium]
MKRRTLLAAAAVTLAILPRSVFGAKLKLNIAFIGMGSQIQRHVNKALLHNHNMGVFCDANPNQISRSNGHHKAQAARINEYADYRQLLEKVKTLDAVVAATPDHWYAPIGTSAMRAGRHVYREKPLAHTVAEARALRRLSCDSAVVIQTSNQGSAFPMPMHRCGSKTEPSGCEMDDSVPLILLP